MRTPILSISTIAYHGHDLAVSFKEIAELGISHVEPALLATYYPEITDEYFCPVEAGRVRSLLSDFGLEALAVAVHMDLGLPTSSESFIRRMEFANALGARIVHTNTTCRRQEYQFRRNLDSLVPAAEKLDMIIALENPGDPQDTICGSGKDGADLVGSVASERVGLNYDFSNAFSFSQGRVRPEEDFLIALPVAVHLHLKELRPISSGWEFTEIGGGVTDYRAILQVLAQQHPDLPLCIELPMRFSRDVGYCMVSNPSTSPVPLEVIRRTLMNSLDFIKRHISEVSDISISRP